MCIRDSDKLYAAVRAAVEQNIEYLKQRRDDDPYESTAKRLPYELANGVVAPTFPAMDMGAPRPRP